MGAGLVANDGCSTSSARVEPAVTQVAGSLARAPFVGAPVPRDRGLPRAVERPR